MLTSMLRDIFSLLQSRELMKLLICPMQHMYAFILLGYLHVSWFPSQTTKMCVLIWVCGNCQQFEMQFLALLEIK